MAVLYNILWIRNNREARLEPHFFHVSLFVISPDTVALMLVHCVFLFHRIFDLWFFYKRITATWLVCLDRVERYEDTQEEYWSSLYLTQLLCPSTLREFVFLFQIKAFNSKTYWFDKNVLQSLTVAILRAVNLSLNLNPQRWTSYWSLSLNNGLWRTHLSSQFCTTSWWVCVQLKV